MRWFTRTDLGMSGVCQARRPGRNLPRWGKKGLRLPQNRIFPCGCGLLRDQNRNRTKPARCQGFAVSATGAADFS